jgi:hypothetical protein
MRWVRIIVNNRSLLVFAFDILVLPVLGYIVTRLSSAGLFHHTILPLVETAYIVASIPLTLHSIWTLVRLRSNVRAHYNTRSTVWQDAGCMIWCTPCALVQMARQTVPQHNPNDIEQQQQQPYNSSHEYEDYTEYSITDHEESEQGEDDEIESYRILQIILLSKSQPAS